LSNSKSWHEEISLKLWQRAGVKPYYAEEGIIVINADCREILPHLEPVDLVLTDPPYGINYRPDYGNRRMPNGSTMFRTSMPAVHGDSEPFDPTFLFDISDRLILWGGTHYAATLPRGGHWLIWDKRCDVVPSRSQGDCEIAWCSWRGVDRIYRHLWDGMLKDSERGESRAHPTQKPLALMKWCLKQAGSVDNILDPFMGSGTTLRAAKDLGRKAIGIEIEEKYCEIAVKRLAQGVLKYE